MKKVLAVVAVVCVVFVAGAALAQPQGNHAGRMPHFGEFGFGCRGRGPIFTPDMTDEIRAKVVEAEKLKIDLDAVLSVKNIDKAKAMEIFGQIQKVEQEIEAWKFSRRLEMIEKRRERAEEFRSHDGSAHRMPHMPPSSEAVSEQ